MKRFFSVLIILIALGSWLHIAHAQNASTWMPDANLRTAVREALSLEAGVALTQDAMETLTVLAAPKSNIANLMGLEYATGLTVLTIWRNQISDLTPLEDLTSLRSLRAGANQISDLTPLEDLTALTHLGIQRNKQITDISPLAGLAKLKWLRIVGNTNIADTTPIAWLPNLTDIDVNIAPAVKIENVPEDVQTGPFDVIITFSETVTGVPNSGSLTFSGDTDATATVSEHADSANYPNSFIATITPTGSGELMFNVPANVGTNADNLANTASETRTVQVDIDLIAIDIMAPAEANVAFDVVITFAEAVSGFEQADVSLEDSEVDVSITAWDTSDNTTFTATLTPTSGGEVSIIVPVGVASNTEGTLNAAATATVFAVYIPEANLRERIRHRLQLDGVNLPADAPITRAHMESLSQLNANSKGIEDLTGIGYATNLTLLRLEDNNITDLSLLEDLSQLQLLYIHQNPLSDLTPLASLTTLNTLYIQGINLSIVDPNPLKRLTNLAWINAANCKLSDISFLSDLTKLEKVILNTNNISSITPLDNKKELKSLDLRHNNVSDISVLDDSTNIYSLYVSDNNLNDISVVANFVENFQVCWVSGNNISDYTPLSWIKRENANILWEVDVTIPLAVRLNDVPEEPQTGAFEVFIEFSVGVSDFVADDISFRDGTVTVTSFTGQGKEYTATVNPTTRGDLIIQVPADVATKNDKLNVASPVYTVSIDLPTASLGWMPDTQLEAAVRDALDLSADEALTQAAVASLTELSVTDSEVADLTGLEHATGLTALTLSQNQISDISPLAGLTSLTDLRLDQNQISDLTPVAELTALTHLALNQNQLTDLFPLAHLLSLEWLRLVGNSDITDTSPVAWLPNLTDVDIDIPPAVKIENVPADLQMGPFDVIITFSEMVTGAPSSDFLTFSGDADATATVSEHADTTNYPNAFIATITPTGSGELMFNVPADVVTDADSLPNTASETHTVQVDVGSPSVSIDVPEEEGAGVFDAVITFTELVFGFEQADVSLEGSTAETSITAWDTSDDITYTATITSTSNGEVSISIPAGVADDAAGNPNTASTTVTVTISLPASEDIVQIPDGTLRSIVLQQLGLIQGEIITKTDMLELTEIVSDSSVSNLRGLEHATNLTKLKLDTADVTDFTQISGLTNLTSLDILIRDDDASALSGLTNLTELAVIGEGIIALLGRGGNLTNLTHLENLTSLTSLNLSNNYSLSNIEPLANLTNLTSLDLSYNAIEDISTLEDLTSLEDLNLKRNRFSGISALEGLTSLKSLSLSLNNPIGSLSSLADLTNLMDLRLESCGVQDISVIAGLTNLVTLYLGRNNITDASPLGSLQKLEHVWLGNNDIETRTLIPLMSLPNLTVYGLTLPFLDANLAAKVREALDLEADANITIENWEALTQLTAEDLEITDISILEVATSLEELSLAENNIANVTPLGGLTSLTKLSLEDNRLRVFSQLSGLTNLTELNLSGNPGPTNFGIDDISLLENLTGLTHLYVGGNYLSDITPLENMTNLEVLDLHSSSRIRGQIRDISVLSGLEELRELNLHHHLIEDIEPLEDLEDLEVLSLRYNLIDDDELSHLTGLTTLKELNLGETNLDDISDLSVLTNLTHLWLDNTGGQTPNDIEDVSPLVSLVNLEFLRLAGNDDIWNTFPLYPLTQGKLTDVDITIDQHPPWDVNEDGSVDATDVALVTTAIGQSIHQIENKRLDVNGDGFVGHSDLLLVTENLDDPDALAPSSAGIAALLDKALLESLDPEVLAAQLVILRAKSDGSLKYLRAIQLLESMLAALRPDETLLLANYPNPFNPETWIPYQLAKSSDVRITIYDTRGTVIRRLALGHQREGYYTSRSRAAYWDGRNSVGERVASGIYFYQLQADNMSLLRKMVILK